MSAILLDVQYEKWKRSIGDHHSHSTNSKEPFNNWKKMQDNRNHGLVLSSAIDGEDDLEGLQVLQLIQFVNHGNYTNPSFTSGFM